MKKVWQSAFRGGACGGMALAAGLAMAQAPPELGDLVGTPESPGAVQMEARGYRLVKTRPVRDQAWSFWWSAEQSSCAQISTADGRYNAITAVPAANCDEAGDARRAERGPAILRANGDDQRLLTLICYGEGNKPSVDVRSGYRWNSKLHRYEPMEEVASGTQHFDSEVQLEISGSRARIHLAGKLVAPLHSGDVAGWWDLRDLRIDRDRITGRYRMNGLNSPKVDIDRRSGRIRIDGIEHFRGSCDQGNWADESRRF